MTRTRLHPKGTTSVPIESDWDDEVGTCPGCNAIIYGNGKCCGWIESNDRSPAAYATTMSGTGVRHG